MMWFQVRFLHNDLHEKVGMKNNPDICTAPSIRSEKNHQAYIIIKYIAISPRC